MPWDRKVFNTDPKHATEREQFDAMVEDSLNRHIEKKAAEKKREKPSVGLFDLLFPNQEPETESFFDRMFGGK